MRTGHRRPTVAAIVLSTVLTLSACGSGGGDAASTQAATPGVAGTSGSGGGSSGSGSAAGGVDLAAAQAITAPYTGKPSAFPIDTPLTKSPKGKKIAYVDCGTPICQLFSQLATPAFQQLGMELTTVKAGFTPDVVQQAFDTVLQGGYDGIFVPAIPPQLWQRGLTQAQQAGIPIATSGVVGADSNAAKVQQAGQINATQTGKVMAAWAVQQKGAQANTVLYLTPELPFQAVIGESFTATYRQLCPGCTLRETKISSAGFGTKAPQQIVDDLQANPDTTIAVFGIGEQATGLPSAMKTAGITVTTMMNSPDPAILEGIQKGDFTAGLGLDLPVIAWTVADSLARQTMGEQPAPGAIADTPPMQILTAADLTGDVSKGWTGYPDFAQRFGALWADAK